MTEFSSLEQALSQKNGQLNINTRTLGAAFSDFLQAYYFAQGDVIQLDNVSVKPNGADNSLKIGGTSSFLKVPNIPTEINATLTAAGDPSLAVRYAMITTDKTASYWKFSNSFPGLPFDYSGLASSGVAGRLAGAVGTDVFEIAPFLDKLQFTECEIVVCTHAGTDPIYKTELKPGINFVGKMRPLGFLGILENLVTDVKPITVFGEIVIPQDDTQLFLPAAEQDFSVAQLYPWEREQKLPGIYLNVDLKLDFKVGKAKFRDTYYRYYAPLSRLWVFRDSTYSEVSAFTALLDIPSADMSVDMIALLDTTADSVNFEGRLEGFSIANLAKLADICGPTDLDASMPKEFNQVLKPLKKLELMNLAFEVSWGDGDIEFEQLMIGIGIPGVEWKIWQDDIVVTDIGSQFTIYSPFSDPYFDLNVWGNILLADTPLSLRGQKAGEQFFFYAALNGADLPLNKFMKKFAPGVPPPSDLAIDRLTLVMVPGEFFQMTGSMAGEPNSWEIPLGPTALTISNVEYEFTVQKGAPFAGAFAGDLQIGEAITIATNYTVPGDFVIRGTCDQIKFRTLLNKLTNQNVSLPKELDFTLLDSSIVITKSGSGMVLQMSSQVEGLGFFAFEVKKIADKWGAAAGISLEAVGLSDVPGLQALKPIEKMVIMEDFVMVISTFDGPQFRFPDMAAFGSNAARTAANVQLPAQADGVVSGLNVYTQWRLDDKDQTQKILRKLFGLDPTLAVTLQVSDPPPESSKFFTTFDTLIDGKWPLNAQLGIYLNQGTPEFFMAGTAQFKIDRRLYLCDVAMSVLKSGLFFAGTMQGTVDFKGFQLSNTALQFGMNWGGIPSVGLAATMSFPSFSCAVAMFFDSTDPSKSVLAGAMTDLSLLDIATAFAKPKSIDQDIADVLASIKLKGTGKFSLPLETAPALDELDLAAVAAAFKENGNVTIPSDTSQVLLVVNKKGQMWTLTNMYDKMKSYQLVAKSSGIDVTLNSQLYMAPQYTQIGSLQFAEGFFVNGALSILGLTSETQVEVSSSKGIAISSSLSRVLIIYKKSFFSLSDAANETGPWLSVATFRQPSQPVEQRNPHFLLSGELTMLGMMVECFASLTLKGLEFNIAQERTESLPSFKNFSGDIFIATAIYGLIDTKTITLAASGSINLKVNGKIDLKTLGKAKLNTQVNGKTAIGFDGRTASAGFEGSFGFNQQTFSLKAGLNVDGQDLQNIGQIAADEMEKAFLDLFKDAQKWANYAQDGVLEGVEGTEQAAAVLQKHFNQSAQEAGKTLRSAGHGLDDVGNALNKTFDLKPKEVEQALKEAGFPAKDVEKFTKNAFKSVKKETEKAGKKIKKAFK